MTAEVMRERGVVINSAAQMLSSGDVNLDQIPGLVLRIINEEMWQQRAIPQYQWKLSPEFRSFEQFVTTGPLEGLGTSVQTLRDLCRRDVRAQEAIDRATQLETGVNQYMGVDKVHTHRPSGNSESAALRRLRKDRPDLLERVLRGELSANAAAVEAGFRHHTATVRLDDPASTARTLRRNMTSEDVITLGKLLLEGG